MKKLFNSLFINVFVVIPFIFIYSKGYGYYNEVVFEPTIGMKCGDGKPHETWINGEHILTPTYDCMTMKHYLDYNKWFVAKAKEVMYDNREYASTLKSYFVETTKGTTEVILEATKIATDVVKED